MVLCSPCTYPALCPVARGSWWDVEWILLKKVLSYTKTSNISQIIKSIPPADCGPPRLRTRERPRTAAALAAAF